MEKERLKLIEHFKRREMIGASNNPQTFREMVIKDIYEANRGNTNHKSLADALLKECAAGINQGTFMTEIKEKAKIKKEELIQKRNQMEKEHQLRTEKEALAEKESKSKSYDY